MSVIANALYMNNLGSNANQTGSALRIDTAEAIGFQIVVPGTGNPSATWTVECTDDEDPLRPVLGWSNPFALPAAYATAGNPAGAGVAIATHFTFGPNAPGYMPRAKWIRLKYNFTSGGAATGMFVGVNKRGVL